MKPHRLDTPCLAVLGVLVCSTFAAAQAASVTNYGRGCSSSGPPPLIRHSGLPKLGTVFTTSAVALPNGVYGTTAQDRPVLLIGAGRTSIPMPPISSSQPPGCVLLTLPLAYLFMPPASATKFQETVTVQVPNNGSLLGLKIHQQWASVYTRSGATLLIRTSDAHELVLGT